MCLKKSTQVFKIARAILNASYGVSLLTSEWRNRHRHRTGNPWPQGRNPSISHFIVFFISNWFFVLTAQFHDKRKLLFENWYQVYKNLPICIIICLPLTVEIDLQQITNPKFIKTIRFELPLDFFLCGRLIK